MREILFRGKQIDNGEWIYGNLIQERYIVGDIVDWEEEYFNTEWWALVIRETVGQYTGLTDKNGKKIFEGDIVTRCGGEKYQGVYEHEDTVVVADTIDIVMLGEFQELEVIGNIHDNPELVEEELK